MMNVEYPKAHDVGEVFQTACKKKKIAVDDKLLMEIKEISCKISKEACTSVLHGKNLWQNRSRRGSLR